MKTREFSEWIASGWLPELIATRQERSLRTAMNLLESGRTLLLDRSLEELSVESVCKHAGATVGSFYARFDNKHAFFVTLQRIQSIRSRAVHAAFVARHAGGDTALEALCEDMVSATVEIFRSNLGVIRASLQHAGEGMWNMFKADGDRYREVLAAGMAPHLRHLTPAQRRLRVLFAFQVVAGTLVHAALNNPGPLSVDDKALVPELVRVVKSYLEAAA
ncbi:MAG: TetR/AcrR family transcriptional regulator [Burkholderiaceae bacterium]|nr:TetR/AcrR family transcriptional regulator [Burkholderiaceae bacterium]